MVLNKEELFCVEGGLRISGTLVNSFSRLVNTIMDVGRSLGSGLRRIVYRSYCPL